ncbi:DUF1761 domain-containing protein [Maricaulis sp.]|uniref:DUF1761 domain-containing protein n=1 Tax=Maricaulis sp. TaxID=1486257 RepID=UPI00263650C6|nr:DUF1761 domain-containing protein [Maricaulis sp.]
MPRILGLNILATLVAAIVLYLAGFIFYGLLFADLWIGLWGFTEAELAAAESAAGPSMAIGFALSVAMAAFLGLALKALNADDLGSALKWAVFLCVGFCVTTMAYDTVYAQQHILLLVLDSAHLLTGFLAMAAVFTFMDKVAVKD